MHMFHWVISGIQLTGGMYTLTIYKEWPATYALEQRSNRTNVFIQKLVITSGVEVSIKLLPNRILIGPQAWIIRLMYLVSSRISPVCMTTSNRATFILVTITLLVLLIRPAVVPIITKNVSNARNG